MKTFFLAVALVLVVNAFLCLIRAVRGPTVPDRILAVNVIGTKTLVVLILISYMFGRSFYIDVAVVYALLNFVVTLAASRYLESGVIREDWQ